MGIRIPADRIFVKKIRRQFVKKNKCDSRPRCCLEILKWMGWCLSASTSRWQQSVHHLRLPGKKSSLLRQISFRRNFFPASTDWMESWNVVKCSTKWFSRCRPWNVCDTSRFRSSRRPVLSISHFVAWKNKNEPRQLWAPDELVPPADGMLSHRSQFHLFQSGARVMETLKLEQSWCI